MSEDCLNLNIYVPVDNPTNMSHKKAVMVYIHGGGWARGAGMLVNGAPLAGYGGVVVVTFNYRLGVFGFLCTGDDNIPGNAGSFDQVLAIKWVKDNIGDYGGDPDRITIFGNSAGGVAVIHHSISPLSAGLGLFQRAISISGTPISAAPNRKKPVPSPLSKVQRLATDLGCYDKSDTLDSNKMAECLREKPFDEVLKSSGNIPGWYPVVDGDFIPEDPANVLEDNTIPKFSSLTSIDLMVGSNSADGDGGFNMLVRSGTLASAESDPPKFYLTKPELAEVIEKYFQLVPNEEGVVKAVLHEYVPSYGNMTAFEGRNIMVDLLSDNMYIMASIATARVHAKMLSDHLQRSITAKTFLYFFDYVSPLKNSQWRPEKAGHTAELSFIFKDAALEETNSLLNIATANVSDSDKDVSEALLGYWSNFAKFGCTFKMIPVGVFLLLYVCSMVAGQENPLMIGNTTVNTKIGPIFGLKEFIVTEQKRHELYVFRGIPYAKPATGDARFKKPVPMAPFSTLFQATKFGDSCYQDESTAVFTFFGGYEPLQHKNVSEDCLYLNIYAPVAATTTNQKAVMVYIHGGRWMKGSGQSFSGWAVTAGGDVLVVTFNYRLGPLGFLSTGDSNGKGNYGLFDQALALKWVKDNIASFGGDVNRITIFGESSGGVDTALHAMSPVSVGLFQRAIPQSGSGLSSLPFSFSIRDDPAAYAKGLGHLLSCNTTDTAKLMTCFRSKSAADIHRYGAEAYASIPSKLTLERGIGPVVDGDFVPSRPTGLFFDTNAKGFSNFPNVDLLIGSNSADGDNGFQNLASKGNWSGAPNYYLTKDNLTSIMTGYFSALPNSERVTKAALQYLYPVGDITDEERRNLMVDMVTDDMFTMPAIATAQVHERMGKGTKTYLYHFDQVNKLFASSVRPGKAPHAGELTYLFGWVALNETLAFLNRNPPSPIPEVDVEISKAMIIYWTNFAKYGNPNGNTSDPSTISSLPMWPEFSLDNQQYLDIGSNSTNLLLTAKKDLRAKQASFWLDYLPYVLNQSCPVPSTTAAQSPCPTCPPIMDQYIGYLRITVSQAQAVIVTFAVLTAFFGCLTLILLFACCAMKRKLKARGEKDEAPSHSNPAFSSMSN
ncbi:uncharacterized protein LOC135484501 [Lineus longissimus]|uniref:uncharacterized protein LOC135484501 n=1 Tax=Lineus longissimus TaxID=88925 RepID=UPI00315CE981